MFQRLIKKWQSNKDFMVQRVLHPLIIELKHEQSSYVLEINSANIKVSPKKTHSKIDFTLKAAKAGWEELEKASPRRGFQCLSTMRRTQNLQVFGDMIKFNQNLLMLEMLFSNISDQVEKKRPLQKPLIEDINGYYINLNFEERDHRVYFEEAGKGIPLLCLHTAGSDSRQYRHLLNDNEITDNFRIIALDMPWHGKSSPPQGFEKETYKLKTVSYLNLIVTFLDALGLEQPIIMGCSIGGRIVLHLALQHGDRLRAVIGLQSALYAEDLSLGDQPPNSVLHRPDIHGGELAGALMAGMTAPQSPQKERWETMWHYMQGGPGVFEGDLHYYFVDGDLRNTQIQQLKNSRCPIYLLNGEYDASATPEMGQELSKLVQAEHFEIMKNMGHFPMSENPIEFRRYLLPILRKIITNQQIRN